MTETKQENPTVFSPTWITKICENARTEGVIALDHLVYVLATDEQYDRILQQLWMKYELDKTGPAEPDISSISKKAGVWSAILHRWAFNRVGGAMRGDLNYREGLSSYADDPKEGLVPYDSNSMEGVAYVKLEDIETYFAKRKIPLPSALFTELVRDEKEAEEFIKCLKVEAENDSEITIQEPGKSPVTYHCSSMGFRSEKSKVWKLLIETLRHPYHVIKLPPKTTSNDGWRNKEYERQWKLLNRLNKKLVSFLNKTYSLGLPESYNLYRRDKAEQNGVYYLKFWRPKFGGTSRNEKMSREELLENIRKLAEMCFESAQLNKGQISEKLLTDYNDACLVALEKNYITKDKAQELIKPALSYGSNKENDLIEVYLEDLEKKGVKIFDNS